MRKGFYFIYIFFVSSLLYACTGCNNNNTNKANNNGKDSTKTIIDATGKTVVVPANQKVLNRQPVDSSKPFLYLTWDDGPNEGTPNLTKLVKEFKVPMNFFLIGRNATDPRFMAMFEEQKKLDHVTFYNHSWSHANGRYAYYYSNPTTLVEDFSKCRNIFKFDNKIGRGPGRNAWRVGNINETDIRASKRGIDSLASQNFNLIGWDIEWNFKYAGGIVHPIQTADAMLAQIDEKFAMQNTRIKNHMILLAHDQMFYAPQYVTELRKFFERLTREKKYNLAFIIDYPECKGLMN
jgi:peptidoglycan-N-acetylglucosamine deacetylase